MGDLRLFAHYFVFGLDPRGLTGTDSAEHWGTERPSDTPQPGPPRNPEDSWDWPATIR